MIDIDQKQYAAKVRNGKCSRISEIVPEQIPHASNRTDLDQHFHQILRKLRQKL